MGAVALIALVITARLLQDDGSLDSAIDHAKTAANKAAPPLPSDTALAKSVVLNAPPTVQAPARADTAVVAETPVRDTIPARAVTQIVATNEVTQAPPSPPPAVQAPSAVSAKPRVAVATKVATPAASKARRTSRWVSSVSQDWVVVRADASKRSRLVASIGPNSRVQLGEARGNWRRIRAKGFAGWVEQGAAFRVVASR